jgi:hypothetical protein
MALLMAAAGSAAQEKLTFRCNLGPGASANWDSGSVSVEKDTFGKPNVELTFDAIDLKAGTGRIIGNAGGSDLVVLGGSEAITLIEQTGSGNFVFTTIFKATAKRNGEYIAVMSRHISMPGGPLPSQYHGTCTRL